VLSTEGTQAYLAAQGIKVEHVKKVLEGRPHIVDVMKNGGVQLVFNTTEGKQALEDSFEIRRTALMMKVPYYTTSAGALAAAQAIAGAPAEALDVRPLQSYAAEYIGKEIPLSMREGFRSRIYFASAFQPQASIITSNRCVFGK
jgi:carbamoyl-phosphate synthase large subunit